MVATLEQESPRIKFPPSHRDFEVHRFLTAEGGSTRAAATRFGISQTRVRQLSQRVVEWAAEVLPPGADADDAGLIWVAEAAACDRLQHHYEQTMEQWHASHQPKFLGLAVRVTLAAAKLPCRTFAIEAAAAEAWERAEEEKSQEPVAGCQEPEGRQFGANPPAGDCSEKSEFEACGRFGTETLRVVTPRQPGKLERLLAGEVRPGAAPSSALRTLLNAPQEAGEASFSAMAESLDLSVDDVLQRQQRKRVKAK